MDVMLPIDKYVHLYVHIRPSRRRWKYPAERYYGHLERYVLAAGAVATEEAIARATKRAA